MRPILLFLLCVLFCLAQTTQQPVVAQEADATVEPAIVDTWQYTLKRPVDGWRRPDFDAAGWKEAHGGFGTRDTPGARVGTTWATNSIWLRKIFSLASAPKNPALLIHHDENAEVYLNGKPVLSVKGFLNQYKLFPIPNEKRDLIQAGDNLLAVHCSQTSGGQFIDVHLVDADNVPKLPPAKRDTKPFQSELITTWGEQVTAENAWTEYPRPQMQRTNWTNLNGHWDYVVTPAKQTETPADWAGQILVPYCLESKLGGASRLLDPTEVLWYRRNFQASASNNQRLLLNFEAVDYRCEVFVNGTSVGKHTGGNLPFSLDVTNSIQDGNNELVVRVEDETEGFQLCGKQTLNPRGIWYTQVSGIWQTVWLETVQPSHLVDLNIQTDAETGSITIHPEIENRASVASVRMIVKEHGKNLAEIQGVTNQLTIRLADAKLWSPSSPHLYQLEVSLLDAAGNELDKVESYAGIRSVGKVKDRDEHWRFTLNGETIFHWGPLDQGWWPDGLLTPPSDEAMLFDIEWLKEAGFNMIRKHIKVEPRRYYYHCDRLGMMVWQDQVSGGTKPKWTRLQPNPEDADWPSKPHEQFMAELETMIDTLEDHPSIVCWVPFNEAWGQHQTIEVGKWTAKRDPSRLVNVASGGNFWPVGDIVDEHR